MSMALKIYDNFYYISTVSFFFFFFFTIWTIFKVFIEFVTISLLFYVLVFLGEGATRDAGS